METCDIASEGLLNVVQNIICPFSHLLCILERQTQCSAVLYRLYSSPYNLHIFKICIRPNILRILPALINMQLSPKVWVQKISEISEIQQPICEKEIENKKFRVGCKIINHYTVTSGTHKLAHFLVYNARFTSLISLCLCLSAREGKNLLYQIYCTVF